MNLRKVIAIQREKKHHRKRPRFNGEEIKSILKSPISDSSYYKKIANLIEAYIKAHNNIAVAFILQEAQKLGLLPTRHRNVHKKQLKTNDVAEMNILIINARKNSPFWATLPSSKRPLLYTAVKRYIKNIYPKINYEMFIIIKLLIDNGAGLNQLYKKKTISEHILESGNSKLKRVFLYNPRIHSEHCLASHFEA